MKKLFLIDGHGLVYRAYYALPYLSTSRGLPTNAVYGFANMLFKLLKEAKQMTNSNNKYYLAVVFDSPVPTFRHIEYKEYKATRPKMPDDFKIQLPYIYKLLEAMNITTFSKEGYEADDLIASIKTKYIDYFDELVIVSGDKDVLALVDNKTKVIAPLKGFSDVVVYDIEGVRKKLGVEPSQIIDFLSLTGDSSDNIPGVAGIGDKTASSLIKKFGSVEGILANLDKLPANVRENITKCKEQLLLSKRLVKAVIYEGLNLDISSCLLSFEFDNKKLLPILSELEFKNIIKDLNLDIEIPEESVDYKLIITKEDFLQLIEEARSVKRLAIITKIDDQSNIIGIGLSIKPYKAFYVPSCDNLKLNWLLPLLKTLLEDPNIKKYAYSIKKELLVYKNYGINPTSFELDIGVGFHLLNPQVKPSLAEISMSLLNYPLIIDKKIKFDEVSIERAKDYICREADIINRCVDKIYLRLKELNLDNLYSKIEHPLIDVLTYIERIGIKINLDYLTSLSKELSDDLNHLKEKIYQVCGSEFNINSPKQVSFILFEKLKLPMQKKTKTQLSTDEEVLKKLANIHPAASLILEYRELSKLTSSYVNILPLLINKKTKRVHTTYNQTQTATGRLSSSEPNLQNIPLHNKLRKAFIPEPGYLLLSADYSQIELRILAHISKDKKLINIFKEGRDVHQETASLLFGAKGEDNEDKLRRRAKVINFGIIYGMSAYGLSKELNISPKEAESIISKYFDEYEGVRRYIETTIEFARENGYVMTLWGRKRYLPHIRSNNHQLREFSERQAINTPIQGSAADLIKLAMINIYNKIKDREDIRMILQVHDELLFEVSISRVEEWRELIKDYMENVVKLDVDLEVRTKIGPNWADMQ